MGEYSFRDGFGELFDGFGTGVERWDRRDDGCSGFCQGSHITKVDQAEWRFPGHDDEASFFFEHYIGCPQKEVIGGSGSYTADGSHGCRANDHGMKAG